MAKTIGLKVNLDVALAGIKEEGFLLSKGSTFGKLVTRDECCAA